MNIRKTIEEEIGQMGKWVETQEAYYGRSDSSEENAGRMLPILSLRKSEDMKMSKISDQANKLRETAKRIKGASFYGHYDNLAKLLTESADIVEFLFEKLHAANMERSAEDCGGWISCKDRLPEKNGNYLCTMWSDEVMICEYGWNSPKTKKAFFRNYCAVNVIAWQPLTEPYRGAKSID